MERRNQGCQEKQRQGRLLYVSLRMRHLTVRGAGRVFGVQGVGRPVKVLPVGQPPGSCLLEAAKIVV